MTRPRIAIVTATVLAVGIAAAVLASDGDGRATVRPPADGSLRVRTVAEGLDAPWEIAFLPGGEALITERAGRVRSLRADGRLEPTPVARVDVEASGESGLLGIAVDPGFERNRQVFLYRTTPEGNEIVRARFAGRRLRDEQVLVRGIPAAPVHDGGRLRFGPGGALYATTGDAARPNDAQVRSSLAGKLLRIGRTALRADRPVTPAVVSLGHRNPQGLDWQPGTGDLYAVEHGPDGDDEVNRIVNGANYGWPEARGAMSREGARSAVHLWPQSVAPSGATFVRRRGSAWTGDLLVATLIGEGVRRLSIRGGRVVADERVVSNLGRVRTIVERPDGVLFALTNNTDGRGDPGAGDDRVVRIDPPRTARRPAS